MAFVDCLPLTWNGLYFFIVGDLATFLHCARFFDPDRGLHRFYGRFELTPPPERFCLSEQLPQ